MATSFSVNRNEIIKAALRAIGKIGLTQTPPSEMVRDSSEALNIMIKQWMTKGVPLWKIQEIVVPLISGVKKYPLGPTAAYVLSVEVTSAGSGYSGASTLTFSAPDAFSGFTGEQATGELVLTDDTVTGVTILTPGSGYQDGFPTITLGAPGSGATFGTPVLVGVTVQRPMRIVDQGNFIRNLASEDNPLDTPVTLISKTEYNTYGAKSSPGVVNSIYYDPQLGNGQLYVYTNVATSDLHELHLFAQFPFEDMTDATTTPDFPQEWFAPLKWGLARELVVEYGVDEITERRVEQHYRETIGEGLNNSVDEASAYFTYDNRGR